MKRLLISILVTIAAVVPTVTLAQTRERVIPLTDLLPFYDRYLSLAPATRDGFVLHYRISGRDGAPHPPVTLIRDGRRTPMVLGPGGRITPPGDLATLRATSVTAQRGTSITLDVVPVIPLSRRITIASVNNALDDYDGARRSAGPMALAAPRLRGVAFVGVRSGQAELPGGRLIALPVNDAGNVVFRPNVRAMRGALAVVLPQVPSRVEFVQ